MNADEVIEKIKADLAWRGPTGRAAGHVVLTREQAEALLLRDSMLQSEAASASRGD
jgi:hypothetical protein